MHGSPAAFARSCAWLLASFPAAAYAAEPVQLTVAEASPPGEFSEAIRAVLPPQVARLSHGGKPFYEFWFRKDIPLAEEPQAEGLTLTTLKEGTLLGALKVHTKRYDFKDLEIPPGAYVMRFAVQPENGNHLGVAPTRAFALLVPAQEDREVEALMHHDAVVKASSKINQGEHPSALNLQRVKQANGRFPGLAVHEDGKFKVLNFRLAGRLKDHPAPIPLAVALVYEGKGRI